MTWRYYIQRALTNVWLDRDAELDEVEITWVLSGPGQMGASVNADLARVIAIDGRKLFEEFSTIVYAEKDGQIRWGGILESSEDIEDGRQKLNFVSFSGYPAGRIYTDPAYYIYEADAFDLIRFLWRWVQQDDYSDLSVNLNSGLSGVVIGSEDPGPKPEIQENESSAEFQKRLLTWQTSRNEPYELAWWNTPNIGSEIDSLILQAGAEYVEDHRWLNDEKTEVTHNIYLFKPNAEIGNVTDPTVPPTVENFWDTLTALNPDDNIYYGLTKSWQNNDEYISTTVFTSTPTGPGDPNVSMTRYRLVGFSKTDGSVLRTSEELGYYISAMGGVVAWGGYYCVLYRITVNGHHGWTVAVYDGNFTFIRYVQINIPGFNHALVLPTLGYDYEYDLPLMAWTDGVDSVYYSLFNPLTDTLTGWGWTHNTFQYIGWSRLTFVQRGYFDYGIDTCVLGISGNRVFVVNTIGGDRRGDAYSWVPPDDQYLLGGYWDVLTSRFVTVDTTNTVVKYSTYTGGSTNGGWLNVQYTWLDGNVAGQTHESLPSPMAGTYIKSRSSIRVKTSTPPEAYDQFSVDAAKIARIYGAVSPGNTVYITDVTSDPWSVVLTSYSDVSTTRPPTRNTFNDLDRNAYTIGSRREDLRFVEGENIVIPPLPSRNGSEYANYVTAIGAGSDRDTLREDASRNDGRLRRDAVVPLKDTYSPRVLQITAWNYLDTVQNIMTFNTVTVFDHPNAQVGGWQLSDEIYIQTFSSYEPIESWAKIIAWSFRPDQEDIAVITLLRIA